MLSESKEKERGAKIILVISVYYTMAKKETENDELASNSNDLKEPLLPVDDETEKKKDQNFRVPIINSTYKVCVCVCVLEIDFLLARRMMGEVCEDFRL